jgi:hypothetical protein
MGDWMVNCRPAEPFSASPFGTRQEIQAAISQEIIPTGTRYTIASAQALGDIQCFDLVIQGTANIPIKIVQPGLSFASTYSIAFFFPSTNPSGLATMDKISDQPITVPFQNPSNTIAYRSEVQTRTLIDFQLHTTPQTSTSFVVHYLPTGEFTFAFAAETISVFAYYVPAASTNPVLLGSVLSKPAEDLVVNISALIPRPLQSSKVFLRVVSSTTFGGASNSASWTSSYFTVAPSCISPPNDDYWISDLATWESNCQNNGKCQFDSKCLCKDGWSGDLCQIKPCAQCSNVKDCVTSPSYDNLPDAKPKGQCECEVSWAGPLCTQPKPCADLSPTVCRNEGQLTELEAEAKACDATKPCQCVNNWSGSICDNCNINCANGGRKTSSTCGCSCPTGFVGEHCECHGVDLSLSIRAYNAHLSNYNAALATTPPTIITPELDQDYNIVKQKVFDVLTAELNAVFASSSFKLTSTDSPSKFSTFNFRVYYACSLFNSVLSKAELESSLGALLKSFPHNGQIRALFVFDKDADNDDATGTITDTPETEGFPALEDEDEEPNSTPHLSSFILPLTLLLSLFLSSL